MFRLQAEARSAGGSGASRAPALPQFVRTDESGCARSLVDLLSNAAKFTDAGFVDFAVEYRMQVATFRITDSGHGHPRPAISVASSSRSSSGSAERNKLSPGLGLGPPHHQAADRDAGRRDHRQKRAGAGLDFPGAAGTGQGGARRCCRRALDRRIVGYAGARRAVVVVDDNAEHRELMREDAVAARFHRAHRRRRAGLPDAGAGHPADLFFVDILMPGMSGWELVEKLREGGQAAPILMLSANIGDGAARTSSDAGPNDAVAKPFCLNQLLDKIAAHLQLDWSAATSRGARSRRGRASARRNSCRRVRSICASCSTWGKSGMCGDRSES